MTRHALLTLALASLTCLTITAQETKPKPEENALASRYLDILPT